MDTLIGSVPDRWQECTLGDCCDVQPGPSGSVLKTADYVLDGVPVVRAENVGDGIITLDATRTVTPAMAERLERYRLRYGDVILVRIGVTTRFTAVTREHDGWVLGGSCLRLRVHSSNGPDGLAPAYLACYLAHPAVQGWLADQTRRGVRSTLRASTVRGLPVVVPPPAVQTTIAATAHAFDTKLRTHLEVIRATRKLREPLLSRLFTGGDLSY